MHREKNILLSNLENEYESLKKDNFELKEDNREFLNDIDKYLLLVNELTSINKEVKK